MRVQSPYLSRVLNGEGHLSRDQLYLFAKEFGLDPAEAKFLDLLLERDRTAIRGRRQELEAEIQKMRISSQRTQRMVEGMEETSGKGMEEYYYNERLPYLHIALLCKAFSENPSALCKRFNISPSELDSLLTKLERWNLIKRTPHGITVTKDFIHLDKDAPVAPVYWTSHRLRAIDHLKHSRTDEDYFLTATFATDERTRSYIKKRLMKVIAEIADEIKAPEAKDIFQLNLDLFSPL